MALLELEPEPPALEVAPLPELELPPEAEFAPEVAEFPVPPPISGGSKVKVPPSQIDSVKAVVGRWAWIKVVQSVSVMRLRNFSLEMDFMESRCLSGKSSESSISDPDLLFSHYGL